MSDAPSLNGMRGQLLIIDDEEEILKALRRQFRRDYEVFTARSADEGYQLMTEQPIQVIISDQRMPGMNGSDFFGKVKTQFPDAMRLLLTGYADIQAVIAAINDGNIFRYITKPWDPAELDTIVREAFQRYWLIVENRKLMDELRLANALLEQRVVERTAELAEANQRLTELITEKNRFLGMAAHDLRSPITVMQGFAELLLDKRTPPEDYPEFAHAIHESTERMVSLLNDILDIAAIESGKLVLDPIEIDIDVFMRQVLRFNRRLAERKSIELTTQIEPGLPLLVCDPGRIEQVLNNLLSNAIKFSNSGTRVVIEVLRAENGIEFAVLDQGPGIPDDEILRVFAEFERGSAKPTGGEGSTGLGLSICKRIVELHDGHISVHSTLGQGSRFYFRLPLIISANGTGS